MRTIVAFLLTALLALAQTAADIERMEKQVADHPELVPARTTLLQVLANVNVGIPVERVRELRRRHILWLIEHRANAANIFEQSTLLLAARGRLSDPVGSAEAIRIWKETTAAPETPPEVVANAAIYLSAIDASSALAILDAHPKDPATDRARGWVKATTVLGLSGLSQNSRFATSAALQNSPEAKAALKEIESSTNAYLVGKAGMVFALALGQIDIPFDLMFGNEDVSALSERWLRNATGFMPPGEEWKGALGNVLQFRAIRTNDPSEKVRLLTEAASLVTDRNVPGILSNLAVAEFDAGNDAEAQRVAQQLLDNKFPRGEAYNVAQTILGRIAAAKNDLSEAKSRLNASITMPNSLKNATFQPNFLLAQDIYDAGDRVSVLEFLEASRAIWKFDGGRIDRMISFVKKAPTVDLMQLSRQTPGSDMLRQPAPPFEGTDSDGKTWTRDQLTGKTVALEFGSAPLAEKVAKERGVLLLKVQNDDTKRRFEVLTNPTVIVIDSKGIVSRVRAGPALEAEWRTIFDTASSGGPVNPVLSAPQQIEATSAGKLIWEPIDNAESYVVEWDSRDEKGWIFDRDKTVRVIPTRDTSATLDLAGFTRIRWRVFAVTRSGQPGPLSPWIEIEAMPVTKIYK